MDITKIEQSVKENLLEGRKWGPLLVVETHDEKGVSFLFPDERSSLDSGDATMLFQLGRSIEKEQGSVSSACLVTNQGKMGNDGQPYDEHLVFTLLTMNPTPLIRSRTYQVIRDSSGVFSDLLANERNAEGFDERPYIDPHMLCFEVGVATAHMSLDEAQIQLKKNLQSFNKLRAYYEQGDVDE